MEEKKKCPFNSKVCMEHECKLFDEDVEHCVLSNLVDSLCCLEEHMSHIDANMGNILNLLNWIGEKI